jgi:integrase
MMSYVFVPCRPHASSVKCRINCGKMVVSRHPYNKLTALAVKKLKAPGRHADGNGLYLVIDPSGARRWMQRLMVAGKRRDIGLGSTSVVSLDEARELALRNKRIARSGGDPLAQKRQEQGQAISFRDVAAKVHEQHEGAWKNEKHKAQWLSSLENHAFPKIGYMPFGEITSAEVLTVLSPIWNEKPETAKRVLQRIRSVIKWAKAKGYHKGDDPVELALAALPRRTKKANHHASLPFAALPDVYEQLVASHLGDATKQALRFAILTACRTTEVLEADWSEIDIDNKLWIIPACRMKAGEVHQVPLSSEAVQTLLEAGIEPSGLIFKSPVNGRALSNNTLRVALQKRLGVDSTVHGLRSTFKDWAAETTGYANEVSEMALAHKIRNQVEAAYRRGDLLEKRRHLMQDWSDFVTRSETTVVQLRQDTSNVRKGLS